MQAVIPLHSRLIYFVRILRTAVRQVGVERHFLYHHVRLGSAIQYIIVNELDKDNYHFGFDEKNQFQIVAEVSRFPTTSTSLLVSISSKCLI